MEKVSNNIKFCTFVNILMTYSSEDISISIKEINNLMNEKLGITLDRRTMYAYIKDMRQLGFEISEYNKEKEGYFLRSCFFKEGELRLLMDLVMSSKFISRKKSEELLEKISKLNQIIRGKNLNSKVIIDDTSKTFNEEIYENLEIINRAFTEKKKVNFVYYNDMENIYNEEKDKQGEYVKVNPICVKNNHKNYYLVSTKEAFDEAIYYKVDNMKQVQVSEETIDDRRSAENISYSVNLDHEADINFGKDMAYIEIGGNNGKEY